MYRRQMFDLVMVSAARLGMGPQSLWILATGLMQRTEATHGRA